MHEYKNRQKVVKNARGNNNLKWVIALIVILTLLLLVIGLLVLKGYLRYKELRKESIGLAPIEFYENNNNSDTIITDVSSFRNYAKPLIYDVNEEIDLDRIKRDAPQLAKYANQPSPYKLKLGKYKFYDNFQAAKAAQPEAFDLGSSSEPERMISADLFEYLDKHSDVYPKDVQGVIDRYRLPAKFLLAEVTFTAQIDTTLKENESAINGQDIYLFAVDDDSQRLFMLCNPVSTSEMQDEVHWMTLKLRPGASKTLHLGFYVYCDFPKEKLYLGVRYYHYDKLTGFYKL